MLIGACNPMLCANWGFRYGPLLLAGLTPLPRFAVHAPRGAVGTWLQVRPGMRFSAPGGWELIPLNEVVDQPYTAYFNISTTATDGV